jgi:hypothetical protein
MNLVLPPPNLQSRIMFLPMPLAVAGNTFWAGKKYSKTRQGFMTQSQRCTSFQPRSAHSPLGSPVPRSQGVVDYRTQASDNGGIKTKKHLGKVGLVTNSRSPLDAHRRLGIRDRVRGEGVMEILNEWSCVGFEPACRQAGRRSPGAFSGYSFGRAKEYRPSRRATVGVRLMGVGK